MPEDRLGNASDEVVRGLVSTFCVGVVFPGRVLLWRTLGEYGSCLVFVFVFYFLLVNSFHCVTICLFNVIQSKAARQSAGRVLAGSCEAGYAF